MNPPIVAQFIERLHHAFHEDDSEAHRKAVEGANVRLLQQQYEAIARGDFAGFLEMLDEDIEMEIVGSERVPLAGRWRGRETVARVIRENFSQLEDQRPEVHSVIAQGDVVVVVAFERGRFRQSGRPYEVHWVQIFTFREGKLVRFREISDTAAMIE
jgi:uncharacterized protein